MVLPWKIEYAVAETNGDELSWHDEQSDAMAEVRRLVDGGKHEELMLVEIRRYSDERSDLMYYTQGSWDC